MTDRRTILFLWRLQHGGEVEIYAADGTHCLWVDTPYGGAEELELSQREAEAITEALQAAFHKVNPGSHDRRSNSAP